MLNLDCGIDEIAGVSVVQAGKKGRHARKGISTCPVISMRMGDDNLFAFPPLDQMQGQ